MHISVKNIHKITIKQAEDIFLIMQMILKREHLIDRTKEHFWTIALNTASKILNIELVAMGSIKRVTVDPTEVFSVPLQKKATNVVLIHNHPSGSLKPSEADLDITNRLIQCGLIMDTPVADHVIISEHSYYSFAESGKLEELRWDNKYALTFIREKQIKQERQRASKELEINKEQIAKENELKGEEKGKIEGAKAEKREIAKQMLAKDMNPKLVQELTGLSAQWLGRLKNEIKP